MFSVVVSRMGVGGEEPLNFYSRDTVSTERQARRRWELLGVGITLKIYSAHSLTPSVPVIWTTESPGSCILTGPRAGVG